MAGTRFSMDVSGLQSLVKGGIQKIANRRTLMDSIGEAMVSSTLERFEQGVGPDGTAWEVSGRSWTEGLAKNPVKEIKDSEGKILRKAKAGRKETGKFGQTLVDTGMLKGSLVSEASLDQVVWGSNLEYAAIHQFGGETGRNHAVTMPARPYIGVNDEDRAEIAAMMHEYMREGFGL